MANIKGNKKGNRNCPRVSRTSDWADKGVKVIVRNMLKVLNDIMFEKLNKNI